MFFFFQFVLFVSNNKCVCVNFDVCVVFFFCNMYKQKKTWRYFLKYFFFFSEKKMFRGNARIYINNQTGPGLAIVPGIGTPFSKRS